MKMGKGNRRVNVRYERMDNARKQGIVPVPLVMSDLNIVNGLVNEGRRIDCRSVGKVKEACMRKPDATKFLHRIVDVTVFSSAVAQRRAFFGLSPHIRSFSNAALGPIL